MTAGGTRRVLVAGIGNVFLGDDGFGVEVVSRISPGALPAAVTVADYGIRGVHLAYELLGGGYDILILVDAAPVQGPPGTVAVLQVDPGEHRPESGEPAPAVIDGHAMTPDAVLALLAGLGGSVDRVLVVGCRPASVGERMGLSAPVRAAVDEAVRVVTWLARQEALGQQTGDAEPPGQERAASRERARA